MVINSDFRAPRWLWNGHLQTLFAARCRQIKRPPVILERLTTPDKDFLDLHWFGDTSGPLVILFHGLEGSSQSNYAKGLMNTLVEAGLGGVVMHFRGCSGEPNLQIQSYHCGHTHDIAWLLNSLAVRDGKQPLVAVGFSIGGAALLNTLALEKLPQQLKLGIAVSPPLEPRSGANRMNRGFSRIYQKALIADCVRSAKAKILSGIQLPVALDRIEQASSFWEFDDWVTAPLHGFSGAEDYYERAAPRKRLREIKMPCHIIHALDDPFFEESMVPANSELGAQTTLELTTSGGHVGFVQGPVWQPTYWLEHRLLQLITAVIKLR